MQFRSFMSSLYLDFPTSLIEHVLEEYYPLPEFVIFPNLVPGQLLTLLLVVLHAFQKSVS